MVSKEVQEAVDVIRKEKSVIESMRRADSLRDQQISDLKGQVSQLQAGRELSDEDKQALLDAINEAQSTNDQLGSAVLQNTAPARQDGSAGDKPAAIPAQGEEGHPTEAPTSGDVLSVNGPANHPAGGTAPLMPNMAFDPAPGGMPAGGDAGQAPQAAAIETAGGFVVSGGGTTQRAPGSRPENPSSSVIVPENPDAKAPASTADLVKSGLGDSSQNALLGNDGRPALADSVSGQTVDPSRMAVTQANPSPDNAGAGSPPGMQEAAQAQQDAVNAEMAKRQANPLNLSAEDLEKRNADAKAAEQDKEDARQGKPPADQQSGDTAPAPQPAA